MKKKSIYKKLIIAAIIVFLILVIPLVLFASTHVEPNMSVDKENPDGIWTANDTNDSANTNDSIDTKTPVKELQVGGLTIQFEEGVTKPEVKAILENCNLTMYRLNYDVDDYADKYYIKVDENKRDELKKEENWNDPVYPEIPEPRFPEIKKGNYYYILVSEEGLEDESVLKVVEKYNLQIKKFVWCYLHLGDESKYWIPEKDALRIKNELEKNETVLNVFPEYLEG